MEAFIKVYFWFGIFALVVNVLMVAFCDFPKTKVETLGLYVAKVLIGIPFCLWAAYLLWA